MMNGASKAALLGSQANIFQARTALFHSTTVVDRKRRTYWESGGGSADRETSKRRNYYAKRFRKLHGKESLLRNANAFAQHIFQNWKDGTDDDASLGQESSWFRSEVNGRGGTRRSSSHTKGQHFSSRKDFNFCDDESDVETIFRSAFGANKGFCWFVHDDFPHRGSSSSSYSSSYRNSWKYQDEEEDYESSTEFEYESNNAYLKLASDRQALGLSISGPLKLEDVKNAYRTCALKWHPDRHHGSSKAIAEEKFKTCSAAYQSLCDRMAVN